MNVLRKGLILSLCTIFIAGLSPSGFSIGAEEKSPPMNKTSPVYNETLKRRKQNNPLQDVKEILVKYKKDKVPKQLKNRDGYSFNSQLGVEKITLTKNDNLNSLIAMYKKNPEVETVQPNYIYKALSTNDADYSAQWGLNTINAASAWAASTNEGRGVTVAVVDSGIDVDHEDLAGKIAGGINLVGGTSYDDDNGHGTHVAGIIAATRNNGKGIAGIAGNARLLAVKVLDSNGEGSTESIANGIRWAADHGANIINLSLGGTENDPVLKSAVDYAYFKGCTIVAAAGNDVGGPVDYPAAYGDVIAVSAINESDELADFSNFGPQVDVAAPGVNIESTLPNNRYDFESGTSMAAPFVAGVAALIKSKNPSFTPAQIKNAITSTAYDAGIPGFDDMYGYGIVNAARALGGSSGALFKPVAASDGYEDNNGPDNAVVITNNTSINGGIFPNDDTDWYKLIVPKNTGISVFLKSPSVSTLTMAALEGSDFYKVVDIQKRSSNLKIEASSSDKVYYINVFDSNGNESQNQYTLNVVYDYNEPNDSMETATPIFIGQAIESSALSDEADSDYYKVNVSENRTLNATAGAPASIIPELDILNSAGIVVGASAGDSYGQTISCSADVSPGTYYIKYSSIAAEAPFESFNYSLNTSLSDDINPPRVLYSNPGDYGIEGPDNTVTVTFNEALMQDSINTSDVELTKSDGQQLNCSVSYNNDKNQMVISPEMPFSDGNYVLTVKGGSGSLKDALGHPMTDDYTINFSKGNYSNWISKRGDSENSGSSNNDLPIALKTKWTSTIQNLASSKIIIIGSRIYAPTNSPGQLYCIDKNTGNILWTLNGLTSSDIAGDNEGGIYLNYNNKLAKIEDMGNTFKVIWTKAVNFTKINTEGGYVYVSGSGILWKLDSNGNTVWKSAADYDDIPFPAVIEDGVVIYESNPPSGNLSNDETAVLTAVSDYDGKTLWKTDADDRISGNAGEPAVKNGLLYYVDSDYVYAVDMHTGKPKWEYPVSSDDYNTLAADNSNLYLLQGSTKSSVSALDLSTGSFKWGRNLDTSLKQAYLGIANGKVIARGLKGIYVYSAEGQLTNIIPINDYWYGSTYCINPVVNDNKLYYPEYNQIVCMDEAEQPAPGIVSTFPSDGEIGVPVNSTVSMQFNRFMSTEDITGLFNVSDSDGNKVDGDISINSDVSYSYGLVFTPREPLKPDTKYQVTIKAMDNNSGGSGTVWPYTDYTTSFTTGNIEPQWSDFHGDSGNSGVYKAIDLPSGVLWTNTYRELIRTTPIYANNTVYVVDCDATGYSLYAVNAVDHKEKWVINNVTSNALAADSRGNIYLSINNRLVSAKDLGETYAVNWSYPVDVGGINVGKDKIYTTGDEGSEAFDMDGNILWSNEDVEGNVAPSVSDKVVFASQFNSDKGTVYALDINSGKTLWQRSIGAQYNITITPAVKSGIVYLCDNTYTSYGSERLFALDELTGSEIWEKSIKSNSTPVIDNGVLYCEGRNFLNTNYSGDSVIALDSSSGDLKWSVDVDYGYTSPIKSGQYLYYMSYNGGLYIISIDGRIINKISSSTAGPSFGSLIAGGNKIYSAGGYYLNAYGNGDQNTESSDPAPPEIAYSNPSENGFSDGRNIIIDLKDDSSIDPSSISIKIDGTATSYDFDTAIDRISVENTLTDGVHSIEAAANDLNGSKLDRKWSFTVDRSMPTITVSGIKNLDVTDKNVVPVISTNAASYEAFLNGAAYTPGSAITKDGSYKLIVYAHNKAGNTTTAAVDFAIDRSSPALNGLNFSTDAFTPGQEKLSVTFTPSKLGYVTFETETPKGPLGDVEKFNISTLSKREMVWDGKDDNGQNLPEGIYTILIKAYDLAGKYTVYKKDVTILYSNDRIVLVGITPNNQYNPDYQGNLNISYASTEDSTVYGAVYDISGKEIAVLDNWTLRKGYDINKIYWNGKDKSGVKVGTGIYYLKLSGKDKMGQNTNTVVASINVDKTGPKVIPVTSYYSYRLSSYVPVKFKSNEAGRVKVKIYDSRNRLVKDITTAFAMKVGDNLIRWDGKDSRGRKLTSGIYYAYIYPVDAVNNASSAVKVEIVFDSTAAGAKVILHSTTFRYASRTSIAINMGETGYLSAGIYDSKGRLVKLLCSSLYRGRGAVYFAWDGKNTSGKYTAKGIYYIKVYTTDLAGNRYNTSMKVYIK